MRARGLVLAACAGSIGLVAAGCGETQATVPKIDAASEDDADLAGLIETELSEFDEPTGIISIAVPKRVLIEEVLASSPYPGAVTSLTVTGGVVEARTNLVPGESTTLVTQLICGAIFQGTDYAGLAESREHVVLGAEDQLLAECNPRDRYLPE